MNRKEYNLLVEGWRKFLFEYGDNDLDLENPQAIDASRDAEMDDAEDEIIWGEIGYLPIGSIGRFKEGMKAMDLRNEGRGASDYDIRDNPFYLICMYLFNNLDIYHMGGRPHDFMFKYYLNKAFNKEQPYLGAVLSKDDNMRNKQLDVIFDVLHSSFPKLIKGRFTKRLSGNLKDKKEVMKYKNEFLSNPNDAREMFAKMVKNLRASGLLLDSFPGKTPASYH